MTIRRSVYTLLIVGFTIVLTSCAAPNAPDYPAAYHEALTANPGVTPPADAAARFAALYESVHEPGYEARTLAFYARELYFNDTLTILTTADQLVAHLGRLHEGGSRVDVSIDDETVSGADVYLRWTMDASFKVLGDERSSHTIGISHLRFDAEGRCVLQQDFWDPSYGFYRQVPVLGGVIERIRRRFDPEPS